MDLLNLPLRIALIAGFILYNVLRYTRSLHRLKRPGLWIQLMAIMSLSGIILGGVSSWEQIQIGLESGLGMSLRALLVIFSFSALSIEIRNPKIIKWFQRSHQRMLFESLSVAFEVLPRMINVVSQKKRRWRHPFRTLNRLLGTLEQLRQEHAAAAARVILVVGSQGSGKTSLLQAILKSDKLDDLRFMGVLTEGAWLNGERDHYHVKDVQTDRRELLCEREGPDSNITAGPFKFRQAGIEFGCQALQNAEQLTNSIVIIDEIGHLELMGKGWSGCMDHLLQGGQAMIWSVRPSLLQKVQTTWNLEFITHSVEEEDMADLVFKIRAYLT